MPKADLIFQFPKKREFKQLSPFKFVENKDLKAKLQIAFEYLYTLIQLELSYNLPNSVIYSIYKDMVLIAACITESCLHFALAEYLKKGNTAQQKRIQRITRNDNSDWQHFHLRTATEETIGCKRTIRYIGLEDAQFTQMIDCAKSIKLLNKNLQIKAHKLRKRRNDVHLHALGSRKTAYSKFTVEQSISHMVDILNRLDSKARSLSQLN